VPLAATLHLVLRLRGSDRRLKCDIRRVGVSPSGIPQYTYRYRDYRNTRGDGKRGAVYHGVMAQDLLRMGRGSGGAVQKRWQDGMWAVDYDAIDVPFRRVS
jgi:hypothetical protein